MTLTLPTTDELVELEYSSQFLKGLGFVKQHQGNEDKTPMHFGAFIYFWERYLFAHASNLNESYSGGMWHLENGFWCLDSEESFTVSTGYGKSYFVNALEFSIIVNLFALSNIAITTYQQKNNQFINQMAVYFSDYIKLFLDKNSTQLNTEAIYMVID